jgi:hypothetical protein
MSDEKEVQSPEDGDRAFLKRQADARFTVTGDAPQWAMGWPDGDSAEGGGTITAQAANAETVSG